MKKALKKKPRESIKDVRISKYCVPKTVVGRDSDGLTQMVTKIDGVKYGWANCGNCHQFVTNCECKMGVLHPPCIEWFLIRSKLRAEGTDTAKDPRLSRDHHDVTRNAVYWYMTKRPGAGVRESLHDLVDRTVSAMKPNRGHVAFPKVKRNKGATHRKVSLLGAETAPVKSVKPAQRGAPKPVKARQTPQKAPQRPIEPLPDIDTAKVDRAAQASADDRLNAIYDRMDRLNGKPKKKVRKKR